MHLIFRQEPYANGRQRLIASGATDRKVTVVGGRDGCKTEIAYQRARIADEMFKGKSYSVKREGDSLLLEAISN